MGDLNADRFLASTVTASSRASAADDGTVPLRSAAEGRESISLPVILVAATVRWPLAARLAISFRRLGCSVQAWCPPGHVLEKTAAVDRIHRYRALQPKQSLRAAIVAAAPDFIVPCDDDAAIQLQRLHDSKDNRKDAAWLRRLIKRSLGAPSSCVRATARGELMDLALAEGVRIPAAGRLNCAADLEDWETEHGFPAVIKLDRSWGGHGVTIVRNIEQARAALRNAIKPSLRRALADLIVRRDPGPMLAGFRRGRPAVTIQQFIVGTPANRAVACWEGAVLAGFSVAALQTQYSAGPATVVQVIDDEDMTAAASKLVRALGLTGLCGLDFMIETATNDAYLIELNPRATPICHLPLGAGRHLPLALYAMLTGEPEASIAPAITNHIIAMFPAEWRRDPLSPYLRTAFHDVPWTEIDVVRECVDLPWEDRGIAARIRARFSPQPLPALPSSFPLGSNRPVVGSRPEP